MKKSYLIIIALVIIFANANAQWFELVTPTINYEIKDNSFLDLEISLDGEPYLLYDAVVLSENGKDSDWKVFAQKYDPANETWSMVGDSYINELNATDNHIAIDSDGNIYVAYLKLGVYGKGSWCTVNKFDGTDWVQIGDWGAGIIMSDVNLYCNNQDDVYVSYYDSDTYSGVVVKRYRGTGSDWEILGNAPFLPSGQCLGPELTTDNEGNVLVSYGDGSAGLFFSVKKFNGTSWEYVGNPGFWDEPNYPTSIIVGNDDIIHATTTDFWSLTSTVLNYQANTWNDQFIGYDAVYMPFTKYHNDVYMGYGISDNGFRPRVKKVDGAGNWDDIPEQPGEYFTMPYYTPTTYFDIEADNNGNLYLAVMKGDQWNSHVSVLKLDISTGITETHRGRFEIYPNPSNGIINIDLNGLQESEIPLNLEVTDISGKLVFQSKDFDSVIDLTEFEKGIYFIGIRTSKNNYIEKVIIQ